MKGKILDFNVQNGSGVISTDDGQRYNFSSSEWKSSHSPETQQFVDFIVNGNDATEIYLDSASKTTENTISNQSSKTSILAIVSLVFGILGFFMWLLGIVAIITGHIARSDISKSNGQTTGGGIALTGLILGYLGVFIYVIILLGFGAAWLSFR